MAILDKPFCKAPVDRARAFFRYNKSYSEIRLEKLNTLKQSLEKLKENNSSFDLGAEINNIYKLQNKHYGLSVGAKLAVPNDYLFDEGDTGKVFSAAKQLFIEKQQQRLAGGPVLR